MYSYGSSARAGVGRQGHGGRNYRPPPKRQDPTFTPPPIKACSCLLELHFEEYASVVSPPEEGRHHACFGGRRPMESAKKELRRRRVHLVVPGRRQTGPVSIIAESCKEALPAADWLLRRLPVLDVNTSSSSVNGNVNVSDNASQEGETTPARLRLGWVKGRVLLNAKNPQDHGVNGKFFCDDSVGVGPLLVPRWLFQADNNTETEQRSHNSWCVMACDLVNHVITSNALDQQQGNTTRRGLCFQYQRTGQCSRGEQCQYRHESNRVVESGETPSVSETETETEAAEEAITILRTCLDNVKFRLGNDGAGDLDVFTDAQYRTAFATGSLESVTAIFQEINATRTCSTQC